MCKQKKKQETSVITIEITSKREFVKQDILLDSVEVAKKTKLKTPNHIIYVKGKLPISIPFNYYVYGYPEFVWELGDLELDSRKETIAISLRKTIYFKDFEVDGGTLLFQKSNNKNAITIDKVKKQIIDTSTKVFYSDAESIIYKNQNNIDVIYFKYIDKEKSFLIYTLNLNFMSKMNNDEKIDELISGLRLAKNVLKQKRILKIRDLEDYKPSLTKTEKSTIKKTFPKLYTKIDSLKLDRKFGSVYKSDLMNISLLKIGKKSQKCWDILNKHKNKKPVFIAIEDESDFSTFLNLIWFDEDKLSIEYKSDMTIILKQTSASGRVEYLVRTNTEINKNKVLLSVGQIANLSNAKFYAFLFENSGEIE